jgi:hypothetical protein
MTYTPDQIAQAIIFEGQIARANTSPETTHPVMTPLQIQIALATALVETNERVLANPNVPESENYPNDGDGFDHMSTGEFQQQPQWWGTVAEEMDPRLSAAMFYNHLDKDMTLHPGRAPGVYAQDVQGSRYPDRYAKRMDDAVAQYNRLAGTVGPSPWIVVPNAPAPPIFNESNQIEGFNNYSSRNGRTVDLLIIHTEEPKLAPYARNAQSLYDFLRGTRGNAAVSYHYSIGQNANGTVDVIDIVDTDYECWAVLDSNPDSINYCFSNSSVSLTTNEWMTQFGNAIDVCAYLIVQDAAKYGVPLTFLFPDPNDNSRYPGNPPGITDHKYVTDYLGDGSHSDVGPNFPFTYFGERIKHYAGQGDDDMPLVNQPSGSIYRSNNDPLPWAGTPMDFILDKQIHEAHTEALAVQGSPTELGWVQAVAGGTSPVSGSLGPADVSKAQAILDYIASPPAAKTRSPRKVK